MLNACSYFVFHEASYYKWLHIPLRHQKQFSNQQSTWTVWLLFALEIYLLLQRSNQLLEINMLEQSLKQQKLFKLSCKKKLLYWSTSGYFCKRSGFFHFHFKNFCPQNFSYIPSSVSWNFPLFLTSALKLTSVFPNAWLFVHLDFKDLGRNYAWTYTHGRPKKKRFWGRAVPS